MMKAVLAALLLFFCCIMAGAQPSNSAAKTPSPSIQPSTTEVDLLKQEVVLLKSFQDNIMKVVIYTLSTVGGIALLLVGYNWWSANKIYDRDKGALKEDILNVQKQAHLNYETKINQQINSSLNSMAERIQTFEANVSEKIRNGLSSIEEKNIKFSQEVSERLGGGLAAAEEKYLALRNETANTVQSFRSELDAQLRGFIKTSTSDLDARLSGRIDESVSELNSKIKDLKRKLLFQEESLNNRIGRDQEKAEAWSSAYTSYFKALEASVEVNWEYGIDRAIDDSIRTLQKGAKLLESEKKSISTLVSKMPDKYKVKTDVLIELAKNAPLWKSS
jgi:hypothetical protein